MVKNNQNFQIAVMLKLRSDVPEYVTESERHLLPLNIAGNFVAMLARRFIVCQLRID